MEQATRTGGGPDVPEAVSRAAQRLQLGELLDIRRERSTGSMLLAGAATFAVGLVATLLLAAWNGAQRADAYAHPGTTYTQFVAPTGAIMLIGIALAVRALVIGTRAHYLYTGGLASSRRSGVRALAWPAVTEMWAVRGRDRSAVAGYRLTGPDSAPILVPLRLDNGRDAFVDRVIEFMNQHGRPVR